MFKNSENMVIISLKHVTIQGEFLGFLLSFRLYLVANVSNSKQWVSLQKVPNIGWKTFMIQANVFPIVTKLCLGIKNSVKQQVCLGIFFHFFLGRKENNLSFISSFPLPLPSLLESGTKIHSKRLCERRHLCESFSISQGVFCTGWNLDN